MQFIVSFSRNEKGNNMNSDTKQMYDMGIENLLEGITNRYADWNGAMATPDRVNQFRNALKVNPGRKFDKVIEKNRGWGFIAKTDGVLKGVPYNVGDVFKAAGWSAPAKWQRGSIFDSNQKWFQWTGPNYRV